MAVEPFLSAIWGWGPSWAPRGWALCAGQLLAVAQLPTVFSLVGTMYGGNGRTTFALPDLRGRVPLGAGQGPGTSNYVQGQLAGQETVTLSLQQLAPHSHDATATLESANPASAAAGTTATPGAALAPAQITQRGSAPIAGYGTPDGNTFLASGAVTGSVTLDPAGGGQPFSVVQPLQAIQFIFALEGIYPSRN